MAQSDTSNGLVKELIAESHKEGWGVFLDMMNKYGKAYFGKHHIGREYW